MPRRSIVVFLILLSLLVTVGILALKISWNTSDKNTSRIDTSALTLKPIQPADNSYFVDPDVMLMWSWPVELGEDQAFAVRIWYGDDNASYRETWVDTPALNATEAINSFLHDVGDYHWQVAVINIKNGGGFDSMGSQWSPVQTMHRVRHVSPPPIPEEQRSAAARLVMATAPQNATELIDAARDFVSRNTIHNNQSDGFSPDFSDALDMMATHVTNESEMPHLVCDGVSTAMLTLLAEFGIDSRLIFLYSDNSGQIGEHTVLEVFNPDTQRWEVQEPSSNRYIVDENGDRASIERLVFGDLTITSVCSTDHVCTPFFESDYAAQDLYEAFRYGHSDTFWVNPDRFDVSKRFWQNDYRNLAEHETGNARDFVFRFDSWVNPTR